MTSTLAERHFEALLKKGDDQVKSLRLEIQELRKTNYYDENQALKRELQKYKDTVKQLMKQMEKKR